MTITSAARRREVITSACHPSGLVPRSRRSMKKLRWPPCTSARRVTGSCAMPRKCMRRLRHPRLHQCLLWDLCLLLGRRESGSLPRRPLDHRRQSSRARTKRKPLSASRRRARTSATQRKYRKNARSLVARRVSPNARVCAGCFGASSVGRVHFS